MNPLIIASVLLLVAALVALAIFRGVKPSNLITACNVAEGTHAGRITKKVDAAVTSRFLLCKIGSDADHVAVCAAANEPLGVMTDEAAAAEDILNVDLLGSVGKTLLMVASEAIAAGANVFTAASGKVQDEPAVAGTYYLVGRAIAAAAADGDLVEVVPCKPVKLVVLAALGNVNSEISALTFTALGATGAECEALRDKCEELADDVRAIAGALATPALVKVLSS